MVGWSRRSAESRERRRRWWASLSDEEKFAILRREAKVDRIMLPVLGGLAVISLIAFLWLRWHG